MELELEGWSTTEKKDMLYLLLCISNARRRRKKGGDGVLRTRRQVFAVNIFNTYLMMLCCLRVVLIAA